MPRSRNKHFAIVAALDIGAKQCGIAFSFSWYQTEIQTVKWMDSCQLVSSSKNSTRVLLDPSENFHSFGFEAEDHFAALTDDGATAGWRLFSNLDILRDQQALKKPDEMYIEDHRGKQYPAVKLYTMVIRYLNVHLLDQIELSYNGSLNDSIKYVITVPGALNFGAQEFMLKSAVQAGIDRDSLDIVFEYDVSAKWCSRDGGLYTDSNSAESSCMLIDLGESCTQIAVFKRMTKGNKLIHQARYNNLGWTHFEQKFLQYLETVFGKEQIDEFRIDDKYDFTQMKREFKKKVKRYRNDYNDYRIGRIPLSLLVKVNNRGVKQNSKQLFIPCSELNSWFEQITGPLINYIKEIDARYETMDARTLVLCGTLAESMFIRDSLEKEFLRLRLIVPDDPKRAVLYGAVTFGHEMKGKHDYSDITPRVVAAFDFGTTYSGYAYSYTEDPTKVYINKPWIAGGSSSELITKKAPTSVLLDQNGQFHSFGFEAEDKFGQLVEDGESTNWRLFRRFKMSLHANKNLARTTLVYDIQGRSYLAMDIIEMALRYLHGHLLRVLDQSSPNLFESEIQYVITVPAIWDIGAKQFMREAAIKAGIHEGQLKLALESEVAALWCEQQTKTQRINDQESRTKYIVIDLGGGTADFTVFQTSKSDGIEMLHKASGGPWGGICVDEKYLQYLESVFGVGVLDELRKEHIDDYFEMVRDFEHKKRLKNYESSNQFTFKLPKSLRKIIKKRQITAQHIKEKQRIEQDHVNDWFEEPISRLIEHVKKLKCDYKINELGTIFLVGGFAESHLVQEKIKTELPEFSLIIPEEADLAVLRGAVLFGHNPSIVTNRVMTHTYGISVYTNFDEKKHTLEKKVLVNGVWKADKCFSVFVKVNEKIPVDHKVRHIFYPTALRSSISVYRTLAKNPVYTTDEGCELIGKLVIKNSTRLDFSKQEIKVTFMFGRTELIIKVKHTKTKESETRTLDCL